MDFLIPRYQVGAAVNFGGFFRYNQNHEVCDGLCNRWWFPMRTPDLRAEARIPVSQKGALNSGGKWFPCRVLDMSDSGLSIICTKQFPMGQLLEFRCELYPGRHLECKIEIRHTSAEFMGAKIVEIDKQGISLYQLFLQEEYSAKLDRYHPI
jgi:hypothetical protein